MSPSQEHTSAQSGRPARAAFTLVELLVVIAIIAVLASLLMPSLQSVRTSAKQTACTSQIRQVMMGSIGYATDNNGLTTPCDAGAGTGPGAEVRAPILNLILGGYLPDTNIKDVYTYNGVVWGATFTWPNAFSCTVMKPPADCDNIAATTTSLPGFDRKNTVYGFRWNFGWQSDGLGEKFTSWGSAYLNRLNQKLPFIADDKTDWNGWSISYWYHRSQINLARVKLAHRGRTPAAYADGHAGSRTKNDLLAEGVDGTCIVVEEPY